MKRWFIIIVTLQIVFVIGEWGRYTAQAASGARVILKAAPVDPRSLFMGNYMALDLEITRIHLARMEVSPGVNALNAGDTVYVGLTPDQPFARPVSVSNAMPKAPPEGIVYIRGRVVNWNNARSALRVDYGIERYYFPESRQAELLEKARARPGRAADIAVTVSVPKSGQAILQNLRINGADVGF